MRNLEASVLSDEQLRSLLRSAIRAPSSHNTQPWHFNIADDNVALCADRSRALRVNDPDDRELTISCGCALMNLRVAAAHAGLGMNYDILPESSDRDVLAVLTFHEEQNPPLWAAELFRSVEGRRTYRKRFETRDVPKSTLDALAGAAEGEGAWLQVVGPEETHSIATLVAEGDSVQWSNPRWRGELANWMRPRSRGDGLAVPGLLVPVARTAVRAFDMGNRVGQKDKRLAEQSPVIAVLGTEADDVADWLRAGQALERVLLTAHSNGLQASYLNQPIQVASLRPKLQSLLGRAGFPQIVLRLGFPKGEAAASARRPLEAVID